MAKVEVCEWKEDYGEFDEYLSWITSCGEEWEFLTGTPKENQVNFCPFCGRKVRVK